MITRVLVTGDRDWKSKRIIKYALSHVRMPAILIHGGCRGADLLSEEVAREMCTFDIERHDANWEKYGRAAGPIRNKMMLEAGRPDFVIAFHNDIWNSKGTKNMIMLALRKKIKVYLYSDNGDETAWRDELNSVRDFEKMIT